MTEVLLVLDFLSSLQIMLVLKILWVFAFLMWIIFMSEEHKSEAGKRMPVDFEFFPLDATDTNESSLGFSQQELENMPYGDIYESGGGMQCCCPSCKYGVGTQDTFIDGYSRKIKRVCEVCGTEYISLLTVDVPHTSYQEIT